MHLATEFGSVVWVEHRPETDHPLAVGAAESRRWISDHRIADVPDGYGGYAVQLLYNGIVMRLHRRGVSWCAGAQSPDELEMLLGSE